MLKQVDSSLGYNHTPESLAKISVAITGKKLTDEQRTIRSVRQTGTGNSFYGHNHTNETKQRLRAHALAKGVLPNQG